MIKVNKIREPKFFKSSKIKELKSLITTHYAQPISSRSQSKFPVKDISVNLIEIKQQLLQKTGEKCVYCESKIALENMTIDHFRPHYNAADVIDTF